jgi:hypothetical protein
MGLDLIPSEVLKEVILSHLDREEVEVENVMITRVPMKVNRESLSACRVSWFSDRGELCEHKRARKLFPNVWASGA